MTAARTVHDDPPPKREIVPSRELVGKTLCSAARESAAVRRANKIIPNGVKITKNYLKVESRIKS